MIISSHWKIHFSKNYNSSLHRLTNHKQKEMVSHQYEKMMPVSYMVQVFKYNCIIQVVIENHTLLI